MSEDGTDQGQHEAPDSLICATANVLKIIPWGEGGAELRPGTSHFRGGARVYIVDSYPGMCESVTVIGHHRASGRYIELVVRAEHLDNFRLTRVYSPKVISLIRSRGSGRGQRYHEARARHLCEATRQWAAIERGESPPPQMP